jgi:hypothetical protein
MSSVNQRESVTALAFSAVTFTVTRNCY